MASRQPDRAKERYWRQVIREWRRSDRTIRDFCDERGLSEPSFFAWRRTLAQRDAAKVRRPVRARLRQQQPQGPVFLPVRVVPPSAAGQATTIDVVLAHGRVVRVSAHFDEATLRRLLTILEDRPC